MKIQHQGHAVKHRVNPQDVVFTPQDLAAELICMVPLCGGDRVLDPCRGRGAFYDQFPEYVVKDWCEVSEGSDFFKYDGQADWIISNPPFSCMNEWLDKSCSVAQKGFAYLIGSYSITPKRLELIEAQGFYLTRLHLFKVGAWFGTQAFVIFEKRDTKPAAMVSYSRRVYRAVDRLKAVPRSRQHTLAIGNDAV